ncbi:MAG: putative rane protein [Bryobacterales bacterium]|nr:putative rane protein [Bryobacterales bacterium]
MNQPQRHKGKGRRLVWSLALLLVAIGLLAAARRTYVLLNPSQTPRFAAAAAMDAGFARHPTLTLLHILPAGLFLALMPLQFVRRIRVKHLGWHRRSGRLVLILGAIVGLSALVMSYTTSIGGANETAATTLFAILFLVFLALGFWNIRRRRVARHREWMIRAFGVALGIATTRPIVGAFFAAGRLSPREFFGIAFWLGFTLTLLGAESWIHFSREQPPALSDPA